MEKFEPLLLLSIAFGMLLANLPGVELFHMEYFMVDNPDYGYILTNGGLLDVIYIGVKAGLYPSLIFMGVGAMTDFTPLIANPKSLLLGAAAQLGVFTAFLGALALGFTPEAAASIGIIGGADGPTAILVTKMLAPTLLGAIAIAAYSYMALIPIIQPPFMKLLTTKKNALFAWTPCARYRMWKSCFPDNRYLSCCAYRSFCNAACRILMLGNLFTVCGVTERLSKTAQNELINIVTIFPCCGGWRHSQRRGLFEQTDDFHHSSRSCCVYLRDNRRRSLW